MEITGRGSFVISAKYPRVEKFAKQGTQVYNDQQVVVDDSFERYSGYEYFGIIDFDEFFVPGRYKTLRETLVCRIAQGGSREIWAGGVQIHKKSLFFLIYFFT